MKINSKLTFFLIILFTIANFFDVLTAMFILPGESNPIYLLTQSALVLWIIKFVVVLLVFIVYFNNHYSSRFIYFSFVYIILIGTVLVTFGIYSNLQGVIHPKILNESTDITSTEKLQLYSIFMLLFMIIPYTISMIAFKIYDISEEKINYVKGDDNDIKHIWSRISNRNK